LLRRCLQKDVTHRLRDIGDARIEIEEALDPSRAIPVIGAVLAEPRAARRRRAITWSLAALAAVSIGVALWSLLRATAPPGLPTVARAGVPMTTSSSHRPLAFRVYFGSRLGEGRRSP